MNETMNTANPEHEELLSRALAAINNEPDLDGPSARVIAIAVAALHRTPVDETPASNIMQRLYNLPLLKTLAAGSIAVGACAVWFLCSLLGTAPGISYGQVADHIRNSRSMVWTEVADQPGSADLGMTIKIFFLSPGRERTEFT
jgi:hypothetical protein